VSDKQGRDCSASHERLLDVPCCNLCDVYSSGQAARLKLKALHSETIPFELALDPRVVVLDLCLLADYSIVKSAHHGFNTVLLQVYSEWQSSLSQRFPIFAKHVMAIKRLYLALLYLSTHPCTGFLASRQSLTPEWASLSSNNPQRLINQHIRSTSTCLQATKEDEPAQDWFWPLGLPLWLVYVSNQWSRSSLYYLVDFSDQGTASNAMNVDVGFDQVQYGILASIAFTTLFAVASLGAGFAADRSNRKTLTIVSAVGWTVATLVTAGAQDYSQVVLARILMGLACAFSTPTAYTLLRDKVDESQQASASSFYGTGVAVASGLASLTLVLDNQVGWRSATAAVGIFGVVAAAWSALALPDDDAMEGNVEEQESTFIDDVQEVLTSNRRVQWIFAGSLLRFCAGLCIGVWGAPFYRMVFSDNQAEYAVSQAFISAVLASLSGILGGTLADKLSSADVPDALGRRLWVPVAGSLLAIPAWYFAVQTNETFQVAMLCLAIEYFVAECWFGPTISTLQASVSKTTGGTAQGLFTLTGAVANLAPSALGYLYSQTQSTSDELSGLLTSIVGLCYLSSAACFAVASVSSPEES